MITINDIASEAGVSVSTVSRVINNRPDVSEVARNKVLEVAHKLNYIPNESARDLAGTQSDSIGLIMRGIGNPFFSEMFGVIEQSMKKTKYSLAINQISSTANEIQAGAELARAKRLSGLIFMGGNFAYTPEMISVLDIPFVCCTYSNKFGDLSPEIFSSVSIDDEAEAYRAVNALIDYGHKDIAILLADTEDQSISELRYRGYCRALKERGIKINPNLVQKTTNFNLAEAYQATIHLINKEQEFTAVFAISDILAMAAIKALHNSGYQVPGDVSVIGIDGLNISEFIIPTLTSLIQPKLEIGRRTVELLLDIIEQKSSNQQIVLETELRLGESIRSI